MRWNDGRDERQPPISRGGVLGWLRGYLSGGLLARLRGQLAGRAGCVGGRVVLCFDNDVDEAWKIGLVGKRGGDIFPRADRCPAEMVGFV